MDINQQMRYSKGELELIQKTFGGDGGSSLLYAIRNILLQFPTQDGALGLTPEIIGLLRKEILPEPESDCPFLQTADPYFALSFIKEMNPQGAMLHIKSKDLQVEYLKQQFALLEGGTLEGKEDVIVLLDLKNPKEGDSSEERYVRMVAFHSLYSYVDTHLKALEVLSKVNQMTPAEAKKKARANSNQ